MPPRASSLALLRSLVPQDFLRLVFLEFHLYPLCHLGLVQALTLNPMNLVQFTRRVEAQIVDQCLRHLVLPLL